VLSLVCFSFLLVYPYFQPFREQSIYSLHLFCSALLIVFGIINVPSASLLTKSVSPNEQLSSLFDSFEILQGVLLPLPLVVGVVLFVHSKMQKMKKNNDNDDGLSQSSNEGCCSRCSCCSSSSSASSSSSSDNHYNDLVDPESFSPAPVVLLHRRSSASATMFSSSSAIVAEPKNEKSSLLASSSPRPRARGLS
jgi:hypothetical protein